jgi:DNA-directed RNA polymerase subunit H (RpoH/RPB5)
MSVADLLCARNNLLEILRYRGYEVDDFTSFELKDVENMAADKKLNLLLNNAAGKQIYVKFELEGRVDVHTIVDELFKQTLSDTKETEPQILNTTDDLLIVTGENVLNETMIETLSHLWESTRLYVSVMSLAQLKFNLLKHAYVPKYEVLNEKGAKELLERYRITAAQLPEIGRYDAAAVAVGIRPGQIVKITSPSSVSYKEEFYRVCVQ